jgi:hypothetical protein
VLLVAGFGTGSYLLSRSIDCIHWREKRSREEQRGEERKGEQRRGDAGERERERERETRRGKAESGGKATPDRKRAAYDVCCVCAVFLLAARSSGSRRVGLRATRRDAPGRGTGKGKRPGHATARGAKGVNDGRALRHSGARETGH